MQRGEVLKTGRPSWNYIWDDISKDSGEIAWGHLGLTLRAGRLTQNWGIARLDCWKSRKELGG